MSGRSGSSRRWLVVGFVAALGLGNKCQPADDVPEPVLTIDTRALPSATVGAGYSTSLTASGGSDAHSWILTRGSLPPGLTLNSAAGMISGTPAAAGQFSFTVQVADGRATAIRPMTLSVAAGGLLAVATPALPATTAGLAYSQSLQASGGTPPYTWRLVAGDLPAGVSLDPATGVVSGSPSGSGTAAFTVRLEDGIGASVTKTLALPVNAAPTITTSSLPGGTVGVGYGAELSGTGGTTPYAWILTSGALPPGLMLNANTGLISGTPTASGAFAVTARVADAAGASVTRAFTIAVTTPLMVFVIPQAEWTVGQPYTLTLRATGGTPPYAWRLAGGALPAGLALNPTTGAVAGSPTVAGRFEFTVQVTDAASATATKPLALAARVAPIVTSASLARGRVGVAYRRRLGRIGGTAPLAWSVTGGELPGGLALDATTGDLAGTPSDAGEYTFTVRVADAAGASASRQITMRVQ